ncbi:MAG: ribonuclease HII [Coriobacteriales bacterium]|nr:ribonuclease HII [Coriobacteriales bacterium]
MYAEQAVAGPQAVVVGIDEVGRGSVAGPLTVAAVALPLEPMIPGLDDSKKLTAKRREALAQAIRSAALAYSVAHVAPSRIDRIGMARALREAMTAALEGTGVEPDLVLIDGNPVNIHAKERCIVKGDATVACIAAASIVAKVTRDALMVEASDHYPGYGLARNKGYASSEHIAAIQQHGLTSFHRATFCHNFLQAPLF